MKNRKEDKHGKSKEVLQSYLTDISKIPLLTVEEERELGYRARSGENSAIQKLVESNLRFVVKIAKKYRRNNVPFLDLINEGNLGLIEAARRFDPDYSVRFISYAIWWIRQSIFSILSNMSHAVRLPQKVNSMLYKVGSAASRIANQSNDDPTLEEIAFSAGISLKDATDVLKLGSKALSLDQTFEDSARTLSNVLPEINARAADADLIDHDFRQDLREALKTLKENECRVIRLRFGLDQEKSLTLKEIGLIMGVSRERVRQIQERALTRLRQDHKTRSLYAGLAGAA